MQSPLNTNWKPVPTSSEEKGCPPERAPAIQVFCPSELASFNPETLPVLVGDNHILRGEVFVIGGEAGIGKSRLAVSLAIAGATGQDWLGLKVHRQFRTLILQNENGRFRLMQDFKEIDVDGLDSWIRISEPPPFGMDFGSEPFREELKRIVMDFQPDVILLDPWNAAAKDDRQKDYQGTFDAVRSILPLGANRPAFGIVAHTRKPGTNEKRTGGTSMMHLLAGSYLLASIPRCIWVLVPASQDETDEVIIICNPKNSNGKNSPRTAWLRRNGAFVAVSDFDWEDFDKPADQRRPISTEDIEAVLKRSSPIPRSQAVKALMTQTGLKQRACYNALKADGPYGSYFEELPEGLRWKSGERDKASLHAKS